MTKISVILPFSGSCPQLDRAIQSVLEDGNNDLELILVNNLGDSESIAVASFWRQSDPRTKLIDEPRAGIAFALNTGIRAASGHYIARMDADDISLPGRFKSQLEALESNPETGLVGGLVTYAGHMDQAGYHLYVDQINRILTHEEILRYRFIESPFAHPSVMFRKSLTEQFGGYSTEHLPEDYELWLRWLEHGVVMSKVNFPVLEWTDSPGRLSRTSDAYSKEAFDKVRLQYLTMELDKTTPGQQSFWIWGAGKFARRKAETLQLHGYTIDGFIDVDSTLKETQLAGKTLPVVWYQDLPPAGRVKVISMVSNRGKPFEIEAFLLRKGYQLGVDFWLCG